MKIVHFFLPHTAFHIASYIRCLRNHVFLPNTLVVLVGLGKTNTYASERYLQFLVDEIETEWSDIRILIIDLRKLSSWLRLAKYCFRPYHFVVANLRRSESLFFARFSRNVVMIDEGEGTVVQGGYLDPRIKERSRLKQLLCDLSIIPSYSSIFNKVTCHYTVYSRSIFPNYQVINFSSVAPLEEVFRFEGAKVRIFVSSVAFLVDRHEYLKWAQKKINESEAISTCQSYFAPHPACSEDLITFLTRNLGVSLLPTNGVLLEEIVFHLCKKIDRVELIGEENTSTSMLKDFGIGNLYFNLSRYGN